MGSVPTSAKPSPSGAVPNPASPIRYSARLIGPYTSTVAATCSPGRASTARSVSRSNVRLTPSISSASSGVTRSDRAVPTPGTNSPRTVVAITSTTRLSSMTRNRSIISALRW